MQLVLLPPPRPISCLLSTLSPSLLFSQTNQRKSNISLFFTIFSVNILFLLNNFLLPLPHDDRKDCKVLCKDLGNWCDAQWLTFDPASRCSTTAGDAAAASATSAAARRWCCRACASWTRCASVPSAAWCRRRRWSSTTSSSKSCWGVSSRRRRHRHFFF